MAKTEPIKLEVAPTKVLTNVDVQGTAASAPVNREVEAIRKGLSANYYGPEVWKTRTSRSCRLSWRALGTLAIWSIPLVALIASSIVKLAGRTSPESLARKRRRQARHGGAAPDADGGRSHAETGQRHELLLVTAMKGYIGERFDRVAASLTADDCIDIVASPPAIRRAAAQYKELMAACEAARYARAGEHRHEPGASDQRIDRVERKSGR